MGPGATTAPGLALSSNPDVSYAILQKFSTAEGIFLELFTRNISRSPWHYYLWPMTTTFRAEEGMSQDPSALRVLGEAAVIAASALLLGRALESAVRRLERTIGDAIDRTEDRALDALDRVEDRAEEIPGKLVTAAADLIAELTTG